MSSLRVRSTPRSSTATPLQRLQPKALSLLLRSSLLSMGAVLVGMAPTLAHATCPGATITSGNLYNLDPSDACSAIDVQNGYLYSSGAYIGQRMGAMASLEVDAGGQVVAYSTTVDATGSRYGLWLQGGSASFYNNGNSIAGSGYGITALVEAQSGVLSLGTGTSFNLQDAQNAVALDVKPGATVLPFAFTMTANVSSPSPTYLPVLGIHATGSNLNLSSLTMSGSGIGMGVYAEQGTTINIIGNTSIDVETPNGLGLVNNGGPGAALVVDNSTISGSTATITIGNYQTGNGVAAYNGGNISFANGMTITNNSTYGYGVYATDPNSFVDARNSTINVNGDQAVGALSVGGGAVLLGNTTINLNGDTDTALTLQSAPGGLVAASDITINANGTNGQGFVSSVDALLDHVTLTGGGAMYGGVVYPGATVTLTNSTLEVNDTTGYGTGLFMVAGGSFVLDNTQVHAYGPMLGGATTMGGGTLTLQNGSSITTDQSPAVNALSSPLTVNLSSGSSLVGGNGVAVLSAPDANNAPTTPSSVIINADGAGTLIQGDIDADVASGSTADVTLTNGAIWSGAAHNVSNVSIDPSVWGVNGDSTITGTLTNGGAVVFTPPIAGAYKTLTTGNYVGNQGTLSFNAVLGDDSSLSDRLIINGGTATGTTAVAVVNQGGAGALTTSNGIQIIQAINGGTTAAGAFTLASPVVAGPFEYLLYRGSTDGSDAQSWYLRSQATTPPPVTPPPVTPPPVTPPPVTPPPVTPPPITPPPITPPPVTPPPATTPPATTPPATTPPAPPVTPPSTPVAPPVVSAPVPPAPRPLYRPEVGAYFANQAIMENFLMSDLADREGAAQQVSADGKVTSWARVEGQNLASRSADGNFTVSSNTGLLQGGADYRWSGFWGSDDRLQVGGMLGYGWAYSDAASYDVQAQAQGRLHGAMGGAYATWFEHANTRLGWYADTWAQGGQFSNQVSRSGLPTERYNSHLWGVSGETGYAFALTSDQRWAFTPQVQAIYAYEGTNDIVEANGTRIDGGNSHGWLTRAGGRLDYTWSHPNGALVRPYVQMNWWHDSLKEGLSFDQIGLGDLYPHQRYEAKVGVEVSQPHGWTGWANVSWTTGDQAYHGITGRIGIKYAW